MSSERRLRPEDGPLVNAVWKRLLRIMARTNPKSWVNYVDQPTAFKFLMEHEYVYVVDEAYVVAYDVFTPWYAKDVKFLEELTVFRLVRGSDFSSVTSFLERKAREAGATLVCAGTALARKDQALASLYQQEGFSIMALGLAKEV